MPLERMEQLLATGQHLQAKREAMRLLLTGELSIPNRSKAERIACVASLYLREYYAAAKHAERALSLAERAANPELLALAHYDLGISYVHVGDAFMAEEHLCTFLSFAGAIAAGAERYIATAHLHRAQAFRQRRKYQEALQSLHIAEPLFRQIDRHDLAIQCHLDLAWCHLLRQDPSAADPHLYAVQAYIERQANAQLAADLLCKRALWHRLQGDLAAASALCQDLFTPGRPGVTDHQLAEAAWIMGENLLDAGRLHEAQIFADMALEHAVRDASPSGMTHACDLRRRLAQRCAVKA